MKIKNLKDKKKLKIYYYSKHHLNDDIKVIEKYNLKITNNIKERDIVLVNTQRDKNYNFEIPIKNTLILSEAESLNKFIVNFGFDFEKSEERAKNFGIIKNNLDLNILKNRKKFIENKKINLGNFFYENVDGNGMIFSNENILNIYNKNLNNILTTILNLISKTQETNIQKLNETLNHNYETSHYKQRNYETIFYENYLEELDLKSSTYLIGDDVFFISKHKEKNISMKEFLLNNRIGSFEKYNNNKCVIPFELCENKTLNELISGNNSLAKYSKSFIANLHTMPLEKNRVDSGSLYEVNLNLKRGGFGIVHVDENIFKNIELKKFLEDNNSKVITLKNVNNDLLSMTHSLFFEYQTKVKNEKNNTIEKNEIISLISKLKEFKVENDFLNFLKDKFKLNCNKEICLSLN